jgi:16S rRNA (cytosine1402-N4)-methyltransferase
MSLQHNPVLVRQVLDLLRPHAGESYLDATAGYGGHAEAVLQRIGESGQAVLVDRDVRAVHALGRRFGDRARIMHASFLDAASALADEHIVFDVILMDLGVSSPQLDDPGRGFSFQGEGPLDMRMDQSDGDMAADLVNRAHERELERIIREYGEEPKARAVARAIVGGRPFETTAQLARAVRRAALGGGDIDPATRTFQAIRIAVNDELRQLELALPVLTGLLAPGGRIAVISFHSLEDRIVKQFFETEAKDCICPPKQPICTCAHVASVVRITKKPVTAEKNEIAINPRARSAKLRAVEKINKNKRRV